MRGSLFGWCEHGRFAHVLIQTGIQVALWSLVFTIVSRPGGITYKLFLQDFPILLFTLYGAAWSVAFAALRLGWFALVSASGKVVWTHDGWLPWPALEAAVKQHAGK